MNTEPLTCAIIGHLVGDYLLQNDLMAQEKKRSTPMCAIHCMIWTAAVMAFAGWYQSPQGAWIAGLLYSAHFVQDRTDLIPWWMRFIGQRRFMQSDQLDMMTFAIIPGLGPWSIIVVDNVWHIVTIWAVWRFLA